MSKRHKLSDLSVMEISLVDRPANPGARVALWKRADDAPGEDAEKTLLKRLGDILGLGKQDGEPRDYQDVLDDQDARRELSERFEEVWKRIHALYETLSGILESEEDDKNRLMREAVDAFRRDIEAALPTLVVKHANLLARTGGTPEEEDMNKDEFQKQLDELKGQVDTLTKERDDAKAEIEARKAVDALSEDERAHYDALKSEDGKAAFLKMDGDARATEMAKNETIEVGGVKVLKSEVPASLLPVIEKNIAETAEATKIAKEEREKRQSAEFAKRAEESFPHLPGEPAVKGRVLKALEGTEDEDVRKAATAMLEAGEKALKAQFNSIGQSGANDPDSAEGRLDKMAKEYAKEHDVTYATAYEKVSQTEEGRALYKRSIDEAKAAN